MRNVIIILGIIAFGFTCYNISLIDFRNPLGEESIVAVITAVCSLCVLLILAILFVSKKIEHILKRSKKGNPGNSQDL